MVNFLSLVEGGKLKKTYFCYNSILLRVLWRQKHIIEIELNVDCLVMSPLKAAFEILVNQQTYFWLYDEGCGESYS